MNLDKYEKIDGGFARAVAHMAKGKAAYTEDEMQYVIDQDGILFYVVDGHGLRESISCFNELSAMNWYIPKPFDVRQAMLERPNEWVGAIYHAGHWFKVGFDVRTMRPRMAHMKNESEIKVCGGRIFVIELEGPDACIPIEDVPEEATR